MIESAIRHPDVSAKEPSSRNLLVLGAADVHAALDGREEAVIDAVADAYLQHRAGRTDLPHAPFLRFSGDRTARIIALPARLEDDAPIAGIKWIASFPGNVRRGLARASAILVLNSTETGRPEAVVESSIISARRTAAGAALAARELHAAGGETELGLVGCGVINFEVLRFVRTIAPALETVVLYDLDPVRAAAFATRVRQELAPAPGDRALTCRLAASVREVVAETRLLSFATTASSPHVHELDWSSDHTVLHLSLRDLAPRLILDADNVTDDIDHVLRANTSLHLTEQSEGHRDFVRCSLADVLAGAAPRRTAGRALVFSPFGLGILDLAVARLVVSHARANGTGVAVPDFLPAFTG